MKVGFVFHNGRYTVRVGNTEVGVRYNQTAWQLSFIIYETVNACAVEWWCPKRNCDLDDLSRDAMAEDEYCIECPRESGERVDTDSETGDQWSENPATLEEARTLILMRYKDIPHNGLISRNKDFCDIMYGSWSLITA